MIELGFASAIVPELTLEEVLTLAAEIGYDCVEVMCWPQGKAERRYAGVTHIDVSNMKKSEATHINNLLKTSGVSISSLGYYPNALSPDREDDAPLTVEVTGYQWWWSVRSVP